MSNAKNDALRVGLRDDDGYPTDPALDALSTFTGSAKELVELLDEAMRAYGVVTIEPKVDENFNREIVEVYIATGGWSGNESIIGALHHSFFWFAYWNQSKRGGAYWFHVPAKQWETPMPEWAPAQARLTPPGDSDV